MFRRIHAPAREFPFQPEHQLRMPVRNQQLMAIQRFDLVGPGVRIRLDIPVAMYPRRQSRIGVEIWPWLVGLVALMLVPEIALRRLGPGAFDRFASLVRRGLRRKEGP